ncbi:autotransporter outer membrane beta-barrel domain-containing protein [Pseudomonas californiensis]|uniref:autotransporter outer membrane beta-barrel domain-containing protein n=1 Tax=Pseudomonas californiensis TaxID=2829823 RepID=UPI001E3F5D24|nr:autotransporter outer membrane beta-barrel domain-containing protein [Pseudomonas californiensis]
MIKDEVKYLDASSPVDSFILSGGAALYADGASLSGIYSMAKIVNLKGNTVVDGPFLSGGETVTTVKDSTLRSQRGPTLVVQDHSYAILDGSKVEGAGRGISVVSTASILLKNTNVDTQTSASWEEPAWGLGIFGARANVTLGSYIKGFDHGIWFTHQHFPGGAAPNHGRLTLDNSTVESTKGSAIRVEGRDGIDHIADIRVQNHSTLISGNGILVEGISGSTVNLVIDDSALNGNLFADDTSILNVTLQNNAQLTGDIVNGSALAITSGGGWQMQGDGAIQSLAMDGGHVGFDSEGFYTLSTNGLSGRGTFDMRVDLDNGVGDLLKVNGQADGEFGLRVRNTGVEVVSADMQPLKVVHTEGGDAQFSLIGGRVDLGAYSYLLEQQCNDWFIVGDGKVVSPSTQSALALFNAAPTIWLSELSTLRSRMGEVRSSGQGGAWMRGYGNRLNASTPDVDYRQTQSGLSLGADAPVEVSSGQLLFGVLGGYSKSDLDLSRGTTGKIDSYYVGAYGTWLSEDGYYLDGVLKLNRFRNKANVAMSDASKAKGDYTNNGVGGWVEFGRHIKLADDYFLEPFAQLSSVVVQGQDFRMDNGLQAKNDRTRSVLAKAGTSVGRSIALKDGGMVQPYVRVAVAQEFSRRNEVKVNDVRFDNGLFGSRAELGAGVSVSLSERLQVHADFDFMKGKHIEQPWGANVGLRLAF